MGTYHGGACGDVYVATGAGVPTAPTDWPTDWETNL
jgi:hypothetical protein